MLRPKIFKINIAQSSTNTHKLCTVLHKMFPKLQNTLPLCIFPLVCAYLSDSAMSMLKQLLARRRRSMVCWISSGKKGISHRSLGIARRCITNISSFKISDMTNVHSASALHRGGAEWNKVSLYLHCFHHLSSFISTSYAQTYLFVLEN